MQDFLEQTVRQTMTTTPRSVAPELTLGDLLRLFAAGQDHAFPVENNGRLVGIVTKANALKAFTPRRPGDVPYYDDLMGTTVDEIMSRHVVTVDADARLPRVLQLMGRHHFTALPVVDDDGRTLGVITRDDVFRLLTRRNRNIPLQQVLPLAAPTVGHYAIA